MNKAKGKIKFCAQSLGAKFALRRMYMAGTDLSLQQLEFVVDFLERETVIHRLGWWQRLTHTERLALAKDVKLKYIYKGEDLPILTSDLKQSYVILRGRAEGYIVDRPGQVPVHMRDGSVFGNLTFVNSVHTHTPHVGWVGEPTAPRKCMFQKVVLRGPSDCLVLSSDNMKESASALAHVTTSNCLNLFGLGMLEPYVRYRSYEPGAAIVRQGDAKSKFYIIVKGTAKATFKDDSMETPPPLVSALHHPSEPPPPPKPKKLDVALLGPQSYVGDIASMFDVPEPVTVKCTSSVDVVYFALDDLFDALKSYVSVHKRMQTVAYRTLDFIVERLQLLFGPAWTCHSKTHHDLTTFLVHFELPPVPPLDDDVVAEDNDKAASSTLPPKDTNDDSSTTSPKRQSPRRRLESPKKQTDAAPKVAAPDPMRRFVHVDTRGMAHVEPTKDIILALHSMHSSFRTSFGQQQHPTMMMEPHVDDDDPPLSAPRDLPAVTPPPQGKTKTKPLASDANHLFLFPTMTKQRQYHGRSLPLLQKCHGIETPWLAPSSSSMAASPSSK
ncbi:Aste57867_3233 [Aphanomyces stellatus]|uniref:Aste57867_3233 protein n=1 Tax=Aphanomyces stellatus TaxID=120398 RepID=A0A485K9Y9_9STRA|nr:hypothetical protein As57867_003223 [Aphanomyces stellatus]VFT80407.1 Aste57867_3233 [Aphanomyces stellatus]